MENWKDAVSMLCAHESCAEKCEAIILVENLLSETEKAFGGCKICYGKGYATTKVQAESKEDFGGEETGVWELNPIRPCSCDRGGQIRKIIDLAGK